MKIAISGYYGFNNAGDEAILEALKLGLSETHPESKISILDSGNRFNFKMLKDCDLLISGGGGLLQDKTSTRSFLYYLLIIRLAKLLGKKVYIFAQGIGPITKWYNQLLLKRALNTADLITVRDLHSFNYLKSLKLKNPKIIETADPTFILTPEDAAPATRLSSSKSGGQGEKLLQIEGVQINKRPLIGVSIRKFGEKNPNAENIAKALDQITAKTKAQIVFIPFQCPQDILASREIMKHMKEKSYLIFRECRPREIMGIINQMDAVIGMRLHSLIFAVNCSIPAVGLSYDPKVDAFMKEVGLSYLPSLSFNPEELISAVLRLLDNKTGVVNSLKLVKRKLFSKAMSNFGMLNLIKMSQ
jgi:polysaccharide pyruvyl transferase CsaB